MDITRTFRHEQYELLCSAKARDNGRFAPAVVVTKQVWPTRPREIAVRRGDFTTAVDAINAAREQGVEWIRQHSV